MRLPLSSDTRALHPPETEALAPADVDTTDPSELQYRTHRRFDRAARLFTEPGLHRLMAARVAIVGVGGVGSFAAESLARSGVGKLVLIDFDRVCITNTNRQLHAMKGTTGKSKVEVMAQRLRLIHPDASIEAVQQFYEAGTSEALLAGELDYVIDCIDNITAKVHLLATCIARGIPVVSSMGAAARLDPTGIRVADLADTKKDPFARAVRQALRNNYEVDVAGGKATGVTAIFSIEDPIPPTPPSYDAGVGFRCVCAGGTNGKHDCDRRARIDGTACFVTGAFGLAAASVVVRDLIAPVADAARAHHAARAPRLR